MNRLLVGMILAASLVAPRLADAQYGIFSTPQDAISPPLLSPSGQGAAPVPSTEIAPGAADLLAPTEHVSPYDPLGSSLESTRLSPHINDQANSLALGVIDTLVPDAALTVRGSELATFAGAEARKPKSSSWEIRPVPRSPLAGSAAQRSSPLESRSEELVGTRTGGVSAIGMSAWEAPAPAEAPPPPSMWVAGGAAPRGPRRVAELRALSQSGPMFHPNTPAPEQSAPGPGRALSPPGAVMPNDLFDQGQSRRTDGFQDSTTGSAYAPQANSTGWNAIPLKDRPSSPLTDRQPSLLWSQAADSAGASSPFRDLSMSSFLSPTLVPPLLSGNSFAAHTLERERKEVTGLNGAEDRLRMRNGHNIERSELPTNRRRAKRMRRYRNPILEQMEEQSSANQ